MKTKIIIFSALALLCVSCNPFSQPPQAGVAKTVNGGVDWQFSDNLKAGTGNILGLTISKIELDPNNRQNVYAGTYTDGMYESTDSGQTWSNVLSKIDVYDFVIDPSDSKTIYAAGIFASRGLVIKTTDGGGSWNQVYSEASMSNAVRSIAINPSDPKDLVIGLATGNVIDSQDAGLSWQLVKSFQDQVNRLFWVGSDFYVLLDTKGLFSSPDFGMTFNEVTASLNKVNPYLGFSSGSTAISHFYQGYVDTETPTLIYLTTDKGLYKTTDGGTTWNFVSLPVNQSAVGARAIAVAQSNSGTVYASAGATVYKSLDGGLTWQTQGLNTLGFVNYICVDPELPQIAYAGIYTTSQ